MSTPGEAAYNRWRQSMEEQDVGTDSWESLTGEDRNAWEDVAAGIGPRCPRGCGCRLGTEDADARECGCGGLYCYDEVEVDALFAENRELRAALAEAASHVEPAGQNSELAIARWRELAALRAVADRGGNDQGAES